MKNLYQKICDFDLVALIKSRIQISAPFICGFLCAFLALNLIFLYHGAHFLFGDHDWKYLADGVKLNAGLFEGRLSQFILINILSQGEIFPIINNVIGFAGFSLGLALLAKYWEIPKTKTAYTVFCLFTAVTPYILSFMYFAFLIVPVLSWNAFIIGALIISIAEQNFSLPKTISASLLITLALGGYPPVINLIAVALMAHILFSFMAETPTLKSLFIKYRYTFLNLLIALIIYKLCLIYFTKIGAINANYYNLQTTPLSEWPLKAWTAFQNMFIQFGITLPFITTPYKTIITLITLIGLISIITNKTHSKKQRLFMLFLTMCVFGSGLITFFLSTSVKETEFSPRIDFFGFMYAIAAMMALLLKSSRKTFKNIAYLCGILSIITSSHLLFEAQKVWHLGFRAEINLYKRIGKRFKENPLFNENNHYIIVQGGTAEFRSHFYHTPYNHISDDLLSISYVPGMASGVMWNYYAKKNYADTTSYVYTFHPDELIKQHLKNARPWPHTSSVAVGGYWIFIGITEPGIEDVKVRYLY